MLGLSDGSRALAFVIVLSFAAGCAAPATDAPPTSDAADMPTPEPVVTPPTEPTPTQGTPTPTAPPAEQNETEPPAGTPAPRIVTTQHEREGVSEPVTFVGAGAVNETGYADSTLAFPVPEGASAVRVWLFWNGSAGLDLLVSDGNYRCTMQNLAECNADYASQNEDTQGAHWVKDSPPPATMAFDEAAIRAGCPATPCEWRATAYANGDQDVRFHLLVEVDTLE